MWILPGRMDRYVIGTVAGAFGACLLSMLFLVVLIDVLTNVGRYLEVAEQDGVGVLAVAWRMAEYYLLRSPFTFVTVAPFVTVISAMFAVSRLMAGNEVVPMLFSGRSVFRVLRPVIAIGVLGAIAMAGCWEFVVPVVAGPMDAARSLLNDGSVGDGGVESLTFDSPVAGVDQTLFCGRYVHAERRMESIDMIDGGSGKGDEVVVSATAATWNAELNDWILTGGERRSGNRVSSVECLGMAGLTPDKLWRLGKGSKMTVELSYSDLHGLRAFRPRLTSYVLAFHTHITFPLANLVLLLLALPFAVHFEGGSRIGRVVFAILVCGGYLVVDLTCQNLGEGGHLHPIFAAWLPTILFGSLGTVLYASVRT